MNALLRHHVSALLKLRRKVRQGSTFLQIQECAQKLSKQFGDDFPLAYAGVLLASQQDVSEALQLFQQAGRDPFAKALMEYLYKSGTMNVPGKPFESILPFEIWCHTKFCRKETSLIVEMVRHLFHWKISEINMAPTIVDLGTGNGKLIAQIVRRLATDGIVKRINLILFDPSSSMLQAASRHCKAAIEIPTQIETFCEGIEALSQNAADLLRARRPQLIIAAASLHHLPRKMKISALKSLRKFCDSLLLFELEADHDLPQKDSPELVHSAANFYGALVADVNGSNLTRSEKSTCIESFFLAEAIPLLVNNYTDRGNFHMLEQQWISVAKQAGFIIAANDRLKINSKGPDLLAMHLKATRN